MLPLLIAQRSDLVVGPTQFESADRLQIFRFEIKLPAVFMLRQLKLYKPGSRSNSLETRLRFANIFQSNDGITSAVVRILQMSVQISNITGMISGRFCVCFEM